MEVQFECITSGKKSRKKTMEPETNKEKTDKKISEVGNTVNDSKIIA